MPRHYLSTGQILCYDARGEPVGCRGTGQDGDARPGAPWPEPRFAATGETVPDCLTGLVWTRRANFTQFPETWAAALETVRRMNQERFEGYADWRLPNRRELRSLISYQSRDPALPRPHPFIDVFLGWYWTSTTAAINPAYAWYMHLEGGRMFYGRKTEYRLVWPVGGNGMGVLPVTGERGSFDARGGVIPCGGTGQDGELRKGVQ